MKVVFVSNYFNHHQMYLCNEIYKRIGTGFTFISTKTMRDERKKMGYEIQKLPEYVLLSYDDKEKEKEAKRRIREADVLIAGSAPQKLLWKEIFKGKVLIRYSERPFRNRVSFLKRIYYVFKYNLKNFPRKNIYMLCASAYTAIDFKSVGLFQNRTYKWGYFPEVKEYDIEKIWNQKTENSILWCGRFLSLKHPETAIEVASRLKKEGYRFHLSFIGDGEVKGDMENLVHECDLDDYVSFLGLMNPSEVRKYMERASIYLFTSDHHEGWGAVLNESMNSGCAVIASHAIGSVPFLIKDGINGYIYESENADMLYEKVRYLLDHPQEQKRIGVAAYQTMLDEWSAEVASERLMILLERILAGERNHNVFCDGPCSKASVISDKWSE